MTIDKSWTSISNRNSGEFLRGLHLFLEHCKTLLDPISGEIACPCDLCGNSQTGSINTLWTHISENGFDSTYTILDKHGESLPPPPPPPQPPSPEYDNMAAFLDEIIRPDNESTQTTGPQPTQTTGPQPTQTTSPQPTQTTGPHIDNEFEALFSRATDKLYPGVRLPNGFGLNFKKKVTADDNNITGMKSHDCHIIMQRLLPYGVQQYLPKDISPAIIELCLFFKQICTRKLMQQDMEKAKEQLINIMCSLEQIYPPDFFDVMIHLVMHLPKEAILGGPVYMRWMYPFERYMKKLKNYVRNKAKPEGFIAEGYVAEEALTFCSYYLKGVETRFNRLDRNGFGLNPTDTFQVFQSICEPVGKEIHQKSVENDPRCSPESELFSLACGPESNANSYAACVVNGVKFLVHDRDIHRTTQNNGVATPEPNGDMFYGQLEEILELTYIGNRKVVLFRCKWFDTKNPPFAHSDRSKRSYIKQGINHILTDKDSFRDQQYILATHARQVFYLEDPARRPPHWKVVEDVHHRKIWHRDVVEDEQDVIHDSNSSDVVLSAELGNLEYTILSTNDESTEVDAPPDNEVPDEESADFIGDEDDVVPHVLEDDDLDDDVRDDDDPASVHVVSSDDSSEDEN
ncbi:hypothetical protein Tco_1473972 [Tanacetum coccineum]